jgi:hypothetical protein
MAKIGERIERAQTPGSLAKGGMHEERYVSLPSKPCRKLRR